MFPVIGDVTYSDTFGAPRDGGARSHEGTDILTGGVKGLPVVAAADGIVSWIDNDCCHLAIDHGDGWTTWYIHLNNDTEGTDDGQGWGIADGITEGTTVTQGQLIGWVGDSGNAEWVAPQLHFELRSHGTAVNPYPYLTDAPILIQSTGAHDGQFSDDDGSVHEANIEALYDRGLTNGCDPQRPDLYCPSESVTRGHIAAFLSRYLDLPASDIDYYNDDSNSVHHEDINALTEAGIAFGCTENEYCPGQPLLRGEMAEFLIRTFASADPDRYSNLDGTDWFHDDDDTPFEEAINRLRYAGVTEGCNAADPTHYCPDETLTRAQMASFIIRAITR